MIRFASAVLVSTTALYAADGAPVLPQGQRDFAMSHMHATRKFFLDSVAGLSKEQWSFKASPEKWSIAECAEHIATSEDYIWGLVEKLNAGPDASPEMIEKTKGKDQMIVEMVPKRDQKFQAPEPLKPKHMTENAADYIEKFRASRDRNIRSLDAAPASMRNKVTAHPALGPLDSYQWALLVSAHAERHTNQILEVKADPNFPKK